jgi:hypothetical protein
MKAFIVLALVACAAARSVDIDTLRLLSKEKSLLSRDDLLLKDRLVPSTHRWSMPRKALLNSFDYPTYPSTSYPYTYGDDDVTVTLVSFEELVQYPVFREYLQIPLFRQFYEQYPTIFRRYVESPLFQRFYRIPQFQQYFRNPYLFRTYIVPQLQVVYDRYYPSTEYKYDVQDYAHSRFDRREITIQDYLNRIFGHGGVEHSTTYPSTYSPVYPYSYDRFDYPTTTPFYGGRFHHGQGVNAVNYKFLLDKIYKTLFVNQGEVTQVRTDVKVAPAHREVIVEPVTGESKVVYEPTKIVDVKVDEKIVPQSEIRTPSTFDVERNQIVKHTLLKRLLVNRRISPELYTILRTLPLHHVKEIVRRIVPSFDVESVYGEEESFPTRHHWGQVEDINDADFTRDSVYRHKINEILGKLNNNEFVGDRYTPVVRDLLRVLGHHNTVRDVVDEIRV